MTQTNKSRVFIIAEAGSNWRVGTTARDLKMGKDLIDAASTAGADAVKFQTFRADTVYVPNAGTSDYLAENGIQESITDIFKNLAMPYEMIPKLAAHCRTRKIEFMSSAFSPDDFKAVNPYVSRHKIASYEITHPTLLKLAALSKKPLILSTGAATLDEIDWAVRYFKHSGGVDLSLMQCTAKYPAPFSILNLRAISTLHKRYGVPVGLSDHSHDPVIAPVAAVALGASIIEKHFTLDRKLKGPDHAFAVIPKELAELVSAVRRCEQALGSGEKVVMAGEEELRAYAQRAIQAIKNIEKGERFAEGENFAILRPGQQKKGAHPRFLSQVQSKMARRRILLGQGIELKDCK